MTGTPGGSFFFTLVTHGRRPVFANADFSTRWRLIKTWFTTHVASVDDLMADLHADD